jgi:hypothetical protein
MNDRYTTASGSVRAGQTEVGAEDASVWQNGLVGALMETSADPIRIYQTQANAFFNGGRISSIPKTFFFLCDDANSAKGGSW